MRSATELSRYLRLFYLLLKTLLLQGLSEPEFFDDLTYKFRKSIGKNYFPIISKRIIVR